MGERETSASILRDEFLEKSVKFLEESRGTMTQVISREIFNSVKRGMRFEGSLEEYLAIWCRGWTALIVTFVERLSRNPYSRAIVESEIEMIWPSLNMEFKNWISTITRDLSSDSSRALEPLQKETVRKTVAKIGLQLEARLVLIKRTVLHHALSLSAQENERALSIAHVAGSKGEKLEPPFKLPPKRAAGLERWVDGVKLTETESEVASLRWDRGMKISEIARYRGRHRKSIYETLQAVKKKIQEAKSNQLRARKLAAKDSEGFD
jgi:hypothetical protein